MKQKPNLTIGLLKKEAKIFCKAMSNITHEYIIGVTDSKAVGTYVEHKFRDVISQKYKVETGNSAQGIDFPEPSVKNLRRLNLLRSAESTDFRTLHSFYC